MVTTKTSEGQALKNQAHHLKPVVIVGNNGLSPAVLHEIDLALHAHELIKVKLHADSREERLEMVETINTTHGASCIQTIGHVAVFYRKNEEEKKKK